MAEVHDKAAKRSNYPISNTGDVSSMQYLGAFAQPLLLRKSNKIITILFWVCVCMLALVIRHTNRNYSAQHYIVTCGQSGYTTFFHIIS